MSRGLIAFRGGKVFPLGRLSEVKGALGRDDGGWALSLPVQLEPLLFSLKTFAAAMLALVASWELEVTEPQWSVITAYLVSQPLLGAILAKGAFRMVGTIGGALAGVVCVALFAQAGPLFILAMALWLAVCAYGATLARNYASYGFQLAAFTAPLIAFEAVAVPGQVWTLAADRATEVTLGIVCVGLVHAVVLPRFAGDALRRSLRSTFLSMARYAAVILRPGTPDRVFTILRRQMAGEVIKFDALRSYAVFEAPEFKGHEAALSRTVRAFLGLLSVGRGLYIRLDDLRRHEDRTMAATLDPALARIAGLFEAIAADPGGARSPATAANIVAARAELAGTRARLEAMVGTEPVEAVANALLVLRRTGDMIESLSRVVAGVSGNAPAEPAGSRAVPVIPPDRRAALAQAVRGAAAIVLLGVFWLASAWTAGATAMTGVAIVLVIFVIVENPRQQALNYVIGATLATVSGFLCMAFVVPRLSDFVPVMVLLAVVLVPAGMLIVNPKYTGFAAAFCAFFAAQVGLDNLPSYDIGLYVDHSLAFLLGLGAGVLAIVLILPYDPATTRRREWAEVVAALPEAARGQRPETSARTPIHTALLKLMPRLDLTLDSDDDILNGTFGAASLSLELIRLSGRIARPDFPGDACEEATACLETLARGFERLAQQHDDASRAAIVDEMAAAIAATRTRLAALATRAAPTPAPAGAAGTIELAHALASLRFIADRLVLDRAYLTATIR